MSDVGPKGELQDIYQPEEIGLSSERLERAYGLLEQSVAAGSLMGGCIQVSRRGVHLPPRCLGRREIDVHGASVEAGTIFLLASVTKPVTATAAMLLVERGELCLDQPVSSIIPEFAVNGKEAVLVHHLLTHTSGLPHHLPQDRQLRAAHAPLHEFVRNACQVELLFQPGTRVSYQSVGFIMLLAIVERVTGVTLRQFMRREIFEPLGMKDTSLGAEQADFPRISEVVIPEGDFAYGPRDTDWNYNSSHWRKFGSPWGGLLTTAQDMTIFCSMFANGGEYGGTQLLSPTTVSRMTTNQLPRIMGVAQAAQSRDRWGLGWRLSSLDGSMFGDLVSSETYGHGGATGTLVWVDPQLELACVILTNDPKGSSRLRSLVSSAVAASVIEL